MDPALINRVIRAIDRALRCHHVDEPARVRLTSPPRGEGPTLAQANVVFRNVPVRVQVPGPSEFIATFLADRLDRRLTRLNAEAVLRYWPDPARPPLAGPTGEKPIVRRQHCALLTGTPDDAVRAMDAMDYDAYLYTDAETGEDAIVYWAGAGRAGLVEKVGDRWAVEERGEHGELGEMWGRKSAQTFHRALGRHAQCV